MTTPEGKKLALVPFAFLSQKAQSWYPSRLFGATCHEHVPCLVEQERSWLFPIQVVGSPFSTMVLLKCPRFSPGFLEVFQKEGFLRMGEGTPRSTMRMAQTT